MSQTKMIDHIDNITDQNTEAPYSNFMLKCPLTEKLPTDHKGKEKRKERVNNDFLLPHERH